MKSFLFTLLLISIHTFGLAQTIDGERLFKMNCMSCHDRNKQIIGPALKGVTKRRSEEWLIGFIRNSQKMIAKGDTASVRLYAEYNKIPQPTFEDLSDADIKAILKYIEQK